MLCISCTLSAPPSLLSALLSPSAAISAPPSSVTHKKQETGFTTYDQKQTGKYNIHLNIKDVAIIALDADNLSGGVGDFGDDYYEDYDLSDFTVKPIFGLIDITSDKPSSTTAPPPLIHFEPDELMVTNATSSNATEDATSRPIEEPILKDPVKEPGNKTQSIVILEENAPNSNASGIIVTSSTPAPENLPPKLSLAELANIQTSNKTDLLQAIAASQFPAQFQTKPNEIPVQIVLDSFPLLQQSSRNRPNGHWRLKNRVRATPSHNRRITPPHSDTAIGNDKLPHRKYSMSHAKHRDCVLNQNGQCQNSHRHFSSPTL